MCLNMSICPFLAGNVIISVDLLPKRDLIILFTNCLSKLPNFNSRFVPVSTFKLPSFIKFTYLVCRVHMCLSMSMHPFSARIDKVTISVALWTSYPQTAFKLLGFIMYIFSMES